MKEGKISFFKSIGGKITLIFVVVVVVSIGVVTFLAVRQSTDALMTASFHELEAVREIKKNQLESYRDGVHTEMDFIVETIGLLQKEIFRELEAVQKLKRAEVERYFADNEISEDMMGREGPVHRRMDEIVGSRVAMGESGETYLMSKEGGRYYFRSDMRTMGDGEYVFGRDQTKVAESVDYIQRAFEGNTGNEVFTDSAGDLVAVIYDHLDIEGRNWIMITKKNLEEAIALKLEGQEGDIFTDFKEKFGYYDLFLIHPEGRVFYSVTHEADYQTNMVDGKYSDSNLGELTREILSTQEFGFADFEPYAPSGGEPAAFVAEPLLQHEKVEMIVALQLPLDEINGIMTQRAGMGETGETYLVGPDHLMRSDSYLDPEHHSVIASFADPERGDVRTQAAEEALAGESHEKIITDYNGNPVVSAYAPVEMFDSTWALLAEIDEAEVRAPIDTLTTFILISALVMIVIAALAAVFFSRTISKPILLLVSGAQNLAVGDIDLSSVNRSEFDRITKRSDELGVIGDSFDKVINYQTEKAKIAEEISNKNLRVEASISSEKDTLGKSFQRMVTSLNELLGQVNNAVEQVTSGADQVSQASQNLSQGATEQASSLEEITSSTNEINSQSKQNAENATEAHAIAKKATEDAESGNSQMKQLAEIMEKINASSDEINKVVKVIDDIAFQINLLALNANVEAARAGKYGKGFAVVADEVRNLAVKSADSVRETTQMVEDTVTNIKDGTEAADATNKQLTSIVEGSGKVANFLEEIAQASREQAQAIEQITEGLDQIDEATQGSTASAEESASASEELAGQAQQLRSMVAQFQIDERYTGGGKQLTQGSHLDNLAHKEKGGSTGRQHQPSQERNGYKSNHKNWREPAEGHSSESGGTHGATGRTSTSAATGTAAEGGAARGGEETGIKPVKADEVISLEDEDFDRF